MKLKRQQFRLAANMVAPVAGTSAFAQEADLAKKLSNLVASLISVPFQFNYDTGFGPNDGDKVTLNIQPVLPISLNENWNVISRTILPVIWQDDIAGLSQFGLCDTTQSLFFSPRGPGPGDIIWAPGPGFLPPSGADELLTNDKWGVGPTGVMLKQSGPWTAGVLANRIWSFAGPDSRHDVNAAFLLPSFLTQRRTFRTFTFSTVCWEKFLYYASVRNIVLYWARPDAPKFERAERRR